MPDSGCPCSHDCFNCLFDDCICGDDDVDDMTALEIAEAEERDRRTERYNCEADYAEGDRDAAKARKRRAYRRAYYQRHRETELAKRKAKRDENREAHNAKNNAYHNANAEEINRRRREKYARNREHEQAKRRKRDAARRALQKAEKTGGKHGSSS